MATNKELLAKGVKYLFGALPLMFIGPSIMYNAFMNKLDYSLEIIGEKITYKPREEFINPIINSNINSNILMNTQFRSVPDGQYTQTIYTLLRDQKYHEVNHLMLTTIGHRYSQQ